MSSSLLEEEVAASPGKAAEPPEPVVLSRRTIVLLAGLIVLPWLVIGSLLVSWKKLTTKSDSSSVTAQRADAASPAADKAAASSKPDLTAAEPLPQVWTEGKKGPWGQIDTMIFAIDVPDECVLAPPAPPVRWYFPDYTKDKVLATLRLMGLPEDKVQELENSAKWNSDDGVASVEPGDRLILGLDRKVRSKLYATLIEFPQNVRNIDPVWFRAPTVDWRLQDSGLAPESIALLKRLLYPQGENLLLFADFQPALRSLPNDAERTRFMKVLLRKRAVLARLDVAPDTDVQKLSQYWGIGGRRRDLIPFLSALHRVEDGCHLNLIYLLPDFARDHLYCHPAAAGDNKGVEQDCFWSAYNFFNKQLNDRAEDTHSITGLNKSYDPISSPGQLGDLVILSTPDGVPIHAAVYLADDIYFTKNGASLLQPWILTHFEDLLDEYQVRHPSSGLRVYYFRRKGL
jgi:hypothetical protein